MRERASPQRVTNVELFFDLVYVRTALETALLLIMVWQLWAYTI